MGVRVVIFSYRLAVYEIWRAFSAIAAAVALRCRWSISVTEGETATTQKAIRVGGLHITRPQRETSYTPHLKTNSMYRDRLKSGP